MNRLLVMQRLFAFTSRANVPLTDVDVKDRARAAARAVLGFSDDPFAEGESSPCSLAEAQELAKEWLEQFP